MIDSEPTIERNTDATAPRRSIEFDKFSFDTHKKLLRRGAEIVPLAPKACELLNALIINTPEVLSKEELMNQVWNDSFVEEANLTHHISALRKALGEDRNGRKFIETIPRKGYRFVAEIKDAASSENTELVFNERTAIKLVEETTVEANDLTGDAEMVRAEKQIAPVLAGKNRGSIWILAAATVLLIGTAAFFGWRYFGASNKSAAPTEISFKRLTPDADAFAPSISPDGQSVVFVRNENGQRSLWRKQIESGEMTQLTPNISAKEQGILSTRFSPDGRWIYYAHLSGYEVEKEVYLYRIPAGGGAAQKMLSGSALEGVFSISPDGKQIAYPFDWRQIIVADIETGSKQIVVDWDGVKRWVRCDNNSVAWSPDGSRLIFAGGETENNNSNNQLLEINLRTNELKQIPLPEKINAWQIEWLPDDSGLVVTRLTKLDGLEIWFVNHHTGEIRRVSEKKDNLRDLRISADGKTIVAVRWLGQFHIWTAPADNFDKRRQITSGAAAMHGTGGLAQMPDGRILYTSTEGGATDIWIMNADGGDRKQLTANAGSNSWQPQLTKDGRYIVFLSYRSGTNQVWRMDADGKNPVQLSTASESYDYNISPEGDVYYITFLADEQKYQIYKVAVEGGEPVKINDYYCPSFPPLFSPDGKWMFIHGGKTKDEKPRNAIVERATGKFVRYFGNGSPPVRWSPDSKSFVETMVNGQQLSRQPLEGAYEIIYDFSPLRVADWDFSADGKTIVFSLGNSTSEIVMIQNFSENIK